MAAPKGRRLGISEIFHFITLHIVGHKHHKTLKKIRKTTGAGCIGLDT